MSKLFALTLPATLVFMVGCAGNEPSAVAPSTPSVTTTTTSGSVARSPVEASGALARSSSSSAPRLNEGTSGSALRDDSASRHMSDARDSSALRVSMRTVTGRAGSDGAGRGGRGSSGSGPVMSSR